MNINILMGADVLALLIAVLCFFFPILVLVIAVVIKNTIKLVRKNKAYRHKEDPADLENKYIPLFGPDNIITISKEMTRVTVEVSDLELVDYDGLRQLGVGVLITGNKIKCSSQEFAALVEEN